MSHPTVTPAAAAPDPQPKVTDSQAQQTASSAPVRRVRLSSASATRSLARASSGMTISATAQTAMPSGLSAARSPHPRRARPESRVMYPASTSSPPAAYWAVGQKAFSVPGFQSWVKGTAFVWPSP